MKIVITNSPSFFSSLNNNIQYSLILVNAVQYQASQGIKPLDRNLTDKNWIYFWNNNFQKDLIDRINAIIQKSNDYKIIALINKYLNDSKYKLEEDKYIMKRKIEG